MGSAYPFTVAASPRRDATTEAFIVRSSTVREPKTRTSTNYQRPEDKVKETRSVQADSHRLYIVSEDSRMEMMGTLWVAVYGLPPKRVYSWRNAASAHPEWWKHHHIGMD